MTSQVSIINDNNVLMVKQYVGRYCVGFQDSGIEKGETLNNAAIRGVKGFGNY